MFWSRKPAVVADVAPVPVRASPPKDLRPRKQEVKHMGTSAEVREYVALCQKIHADTPVVRMLQLRQFLAERGIPDYQSIQVHSYLYNMAEEREKTGGYFSYKWHPLREEDKEVTFRWWWKHVDKCESTGTLYHKLVPGSVLATVATILETFPDAKFFVSDISGVEDPFLLVTFPDVDPVIIDFWNEPGFRPA